MTKSEIVYQKIERLVSVIDSAEVAHVSAERHDHVLLAMAAISRCRSLLLGTLELHRAGRRDILGVLVRSLLEAWYFGVIALLGDKADLDRLEKDHRYWKNDLAKRFPGVEPDEGDVGKFSVYQRATRADELLLGIGQPSGVALQYYQLFYAGESLTSAHAGFQSLDAYVFEEGGIIGIVREPEDDDINQGRLNIAMILTILLVKWTWDRAGIDSRPLEEIER